MADTDTTKQGGQQRRGPRIRRRKQEAAPASPVERAALRGLMARRAAARMDAGGPWQWPWRRRRRRRRMRGCLLWLLTLLAVLLVLGLLFGGFQRGTKVGSGAPAPATATASPAAAPLTTALRC